METILGKSLQFLMGINLENEDDHKNEDNLKNEDDLKRKTTSKIKTTKIWRWPKYEDNLDIKTS